MVRLTQLRRARLDAGLTQFQLSARTGISTGRLSLLERELVQPSDAERERIEAALAAVPVHRAGSGAHP
jgi:transcriptional regulator with XRE-family HTH domain